MVAGDRMCMALDALACASHDASCSMLAHNCEAVHRLMQLQRAQTESYNPLAPPVSVDARDGLIGACCSTCTSLKLGTVRVCHGGVPKALSDQLWSTCTLYLNVPALSPDQL